MDRMMGVNNPVSLTFSISVSDVLYIVSSISPGGYKHLMNDLGPICDGVGPITKSMLQNLKCHYHQQF